MYVYLACMYPCVKRVCSAHGGQERAVGALDLELQKVVSCGCWEWNLGLLEEQ